ncbi:acyltransferase family protein [Francisella philomiragia]|uniref:acyltransferase family protein n=1 Tax=Francisella philomiragia TaxID=28110 RepID=UPI0005A57E40|nr:acyltransferase family protein [Francisella philomiragia]AJI55737.1 acyltransferase family protein [Francisella philomiragia]MBK2253649.1 acyltransferase [Francisella philomiragia]
MSGIRYRSDIDGLRAFAVLSVVLYHLEVSWVKSGFLGVDIFFVISGFLITKIIVRDLQSGTFSIKNFYLRRIRRILPALIFVLVLSSFFAWLILLQQDLLNYAKSMVSVIASISNLFFFKTLSFGYFATDSSTIPLLHTWSLGVEEQFYIIWPVILIILFKLNISSKKYLLTITSLLIIASIAIFFYKHFPKFYYIPLNRGFEQLFGCFLAISLSNREHKLPNKILLDIYSIVSLVLMVVPIFLISVNYPSFWMIVACLGATLFIYSGSLGYTPIINRLFSIKPFVAIGLISYSLYLWHWPIIAYLNYLSITITVDIAAIVIILSIILATISYVFVEKPFRHKFKFSFLKSLTILWIIPLVISIGFCIASKHQGFGFNQSFHVDQNQLTFSYGFSEFDNNHCFLQAESTTFKSIDLPTKDLCIIGSHSYKNTDILFIGDSHARSEYPMLSVWLKSAGLSAYAITQRSTPFLYGMNDNEQGISKLDRNVAIKKLIETRFYKYIILGGAWSSPAYSGFIELLDKSIHLIVKSGAQPILILDTPYLPERLNNLCPLSNSEILKYFNLANCSIKRSYVDQSEHKFHTLVKFLLVKYPTLRVINPKKAICNSKEYQISIEGVPIYADNQHMNYIGSKLLGELYLKEFGNPLIAIIKKTN